MVDVVQRLEHRIVIPGVVGSNPIIHPVPFRESHGRGHFLYISLAPYITASYEDFTASLRLLILIKNW